MHSDQVYSLGDSPGPSPDMVTEQLDIHVRGATTEQIGQSELVTDQLGTLEISSETMTIIEAEGTKALPVFTTLQATAGEEGLLVNNTDVTTVSTADASCELEHKIPFLGFASASHLFNKIKQDQGWPLYPNTSQKPPDKTSTS